MRSSESSGSGKKGRARRASVSTTVSRGPTERAFLVGIDYHVRSRAGTAAKNAKNSLTSAAQAARDSASSVPGPSKAPAVPEFSAEESLDELRSLATSAGAQIAGEFLQHRDRPDPATLIGKGKLEKIANAAASVSADLILFDHDLTASQQRNIEKVVHTRVIDRTQLILDIFAKHARTREGQLQVELAQLEYMLPRLGGRGIEMSQLGGGIGTRGPGETQLETDRRKIYRRVRHVKEQIESVRRIRAQQRQRRESVPVALIALVGYTNAGKSTLFNALTHSEVLTSSKMFATLDPTVRAVRLPSRRRALLSDTVGFLRDLPPDLIAAFRATLEEVQEAALIVQVSDISDPNHAGQDADVLKVLTDLGVQDRPRLQVFNKTDLLSEEELATLLKANGRAANKVFTSAVTGYGLDDLLARMDAELPVDPLVHLNLRIPVSDGRHLSLVHACGRVLNSKILDNHMYLEVELPESFARRLEDFVFPATAPAPSGPPAANAKV